MKILGLTPKRYMAGCVILAVLAIPMAIAAIITVGHAITTSCALLLAAAVGLHLDRKTRPSG